MGEHDLLGGPRILLVEDHPFQLIGLEMLLNHWRPSRTVTVTTCCCAISTYRMVAASI
jgi:hypothetical protein